MSPGDIRPEPNVARFGLETFRRMSPGDIRAVARHSEKLVRVLTFFALVSLREWPGDIRC